MCALAVLAPDPEWPRRAQAILTEVMRSVGADVRHADHIGSTAIAGKWAKDVVDLHLSVLDVDLVISAALSWSEASDWHPHGR